MLSKVIVMIGMTSLIIVLIIGGLLILVNAFKEAWEDRDLGSLFVLTLIACLGMMLIGILISLIGL